MKRDFRLTRSTDFQRVRRYGESYAHPLIVLITLPNHLERSRFGVTAGRSVGNAVARNRAKRLLREALRSLLPGMAPGWDAVVIARKSMHSANLHQVQDALYVLMRRAKLLRNDHVG